MTQENRIKLRPTEAAVYINKSVANLYWKAKNEPGFPKPRKYPNRRASYFYKDEIDAWMAKQADLAWRLNAPAAAIPLYNADDLNAGKRALWCAYLLGLSPCEVFPQDRASDPEGTEHLADYMYGLVQALHANAPQPNPSDKELTGFLRTLKHCEAVLDGRAEPEIRGPNGFENRGQYRRGIYLQKGSYSNGNA